MCDEVPSARLGQKRLRLTQGGHKVWTCPRVSEGVDICGDDQGEASPVQFPDNDLWTGGQEAERDEFDAPPDRSCHFREVATLGHRIPGQTGYASREAGIPDQ